MIFAIVSKADPKHVMRSRVPAQSKIVPKYFLTNTCQLHEFKHFPRMSVKKRMAVSVGQSLGEEQLFATNLQGYSMFRTSERRG